MIGHANKFTFVLKLDPKMINQEGSNFGKDKDHVTQKATCVGSNFFWLNRCGRVFETGNFCFCGSWFKICIYQYLLVHHSCPSDCRYKSHTTGRIQKQAPRGADAVMQRDDILLVDDTRNRCARESEVVTGAKVRTQGSRRTLWSWTEIFLFSKC